MKTYNFTKDFKKAINTLIRNLLINSTDINPNYIRQQGQNITFSSDLNCVFYDLVSLEPLQDSYINSDVIKRYYKIQFNITSYGADSFENLVNFTNYLHTFKALRELRKYKIGLNQVSSINILNDLIQDNFIKRADLSLNLSFEFEEAQQDYLEIFKIEVIA